MPQVTYISHDGTAREVEAQSGSTLMQTAVDNMIEGIVAECGGACACATCHCYLDADGISKVPAAEELEIDMLECAVEPTEQSRLSCQVVVTDAMDGLIVRLPESQH